LYGTYLKLRIDRINKFETLGYKAVFPTSDKEIIPQDQLEALKCDQMWPARNEIYYRRGYCFTTEIGQNYFKSDKDCPRNCASRKEINEVVKRSMSRVEDENIRNIGAREVEEGCPRAKIIPVC
jgi:YARHG domain